MVVFRKGVIAVNWLNDFLNDTKHNLPFEIPKETTEKLHSYFELFKEKANEVKQSLGEQMKEFGAQTSLKTEQASLEQPLFGERRSMEQQEAARTAEESKGKAPVSTSTVKNARLSEDKEIWVKYKIKMKKDEGEIKLPKDSTEEDMNRAILQQSGYRVTTTIVDGAAQGRKNSSALTGFNSYASLFSKF